MPIDTRSFLSDRYSLILSLEHEHHVTTNPAGAHSDRALFRVKRSSSAGCLRNGPHGRLFRRNQMNKKQLLVVLAHAFVGWLLCFAVMGIGMATTSLDNALIIHAAAAPIIFGSISLIYFTRFNYTTPLQTALIFVGFVITVDFFVVALLINRSLAMFASLLGTWIPFTLIFLSTYLVGLYRNKISASAGSQ
jgi:hypothetical protein